jgi:uncharacterized protein
MVTTAFQHGVTWSDVPTAILVPIRSPSGINFVVGCAPIHLAATPAPINRPRLYNTYAQAVREMGFSYDFVNFNISEHMDAAFVRFGVGPVVYNNVFDPARHRRSIASRPLSVINGLAVIPDLLVIPASIRLTLDDEDLEPLVDFVATHNVGTGRVEIAFLTEDVEDGTTGLMARFDVADTSLVTKSDIIGGYDLVTGKPTGLECVEEVFPLFGYIPSIILSPGFSSDPEVASVMVAKCESINGAFRARCAIDVNTRLAPHPMDVPNYKRQNNLVFARQDVLYPKLALGERNYRFSSQWGPLQMFTDATRGFNVPYFSPSNKNLRMTGTVIAGEGDNVVEQTVDFRDANYLNSQGITTSINTSGGWKAWGNRTAIFPGDNDPKDIWIPVRRMFDYIGNNVVLTVQSQVDEPGNRRLIDRVITTINNVLNGYIGMGALLGARCEFREDENPQTQILDGHYVFHLFLGVPIPAEWIEFKIEYDVSYLSTLFAEAA